MSVLDVTNGDVRLGWDSPVKEVVHPSFINLHDRGGLGWLDGFSEWMVRAGLAFAGHPGRDTFTNELGDEETHDLTLHGKIGNTPASEVTVQVIQNNVYIRGRVDEISTFGTNLELWTEVSTEVGSSQIHFHDVLKNNGAFNQEYALIYHTNFGPNLLGAGSEFFSAAQKIVPFDAVAAKDINSRTVYDGPTWGYKEHLYNIWPKSDENGLAMAVLSNPTRDRGVSVVWPREDLPYLSQWKNTVDEKTGYVTGIEPGTQFVQNRNHERRMGRVKKLEPGAVRKFDLTFRILSDAKEVQSAVHAVHKLQGKTDVVVDAVPEEVVQ
eukprot:gnl/MRDRNA2_/MRDRNA2_16738_c0_seq1.p1 gnl/MRDRNA2_/MRDRNA2_16738_c0~~gnl/MRDRNA2_/MRDRNA2_16738_c0_seq1.p1  ORF type:complete len:324 (+),score=60.01 gnl/MRDRNA2_/MRDRNA2_16738_c0_seq1:150-1121(+)